MALVPGPFWENDLATLTPVPAELIRRDAELRKSLAAPDVRQMLVLEGTDREDALVRSEALMPELDRLVAGHALEERQQRSGVAAHQGFERLAFAARDLGHQRFVAVVHCRPRRAE